MITQVVKRLNLRVTLSTTIKRYLSEGNKIAIGEYNINFVKAGKGKHNVFFLPGALGSAKTDFGLQLRNMNHEKFTLYAWDPPGYGFSRPPDRTFPSDFFERDARVAADLLKKLNVSPISLVGWSDGGITALILAAINPEIVNKLVVFGANAYVSQRDLEFYKAVSDIDKWSPHMRAPMIELYGEDYFRRMWNEWYNLLTKYGLENIDGDICRKHVKMIKCPTLILHGVKDAMVPPEHPEYLKTNIKHAKYIEFPEGKHNLHMKFSEKFNKIVEEFLES